MDIFKIFDEYVKKGGEYAQTLQVVMINLGDDFFPLLEKAEKQGKKIQINETNLPDGWDGFTIADVELV